MNTELNAKILAVIQTVGRNDYLQRSALGMARSWVDKRKPIDRPEKYLDGSWEKRDDLAASLVAIMEDNPSERADYILALGKAREWVNEPFIDPTMLGQRAGKQLQKPKDTKKDK